MNNFFIPAWQVPQNIQSLQTIRTGGSSLAPSDSFNLALHVEDDIAHVMQNRALLRQQLPAEPLWLTQVHGISVVDAALATSGVAADAAFSRKPGVVCAVMTADCLPVLLCDRKGSVVGAAHAGWRGLVAGVLEALIARMEVPTSELFAWLGPAISQRAFEVGDEVRQAFIEKQAASAMAFIAAGTGKWMADLYALARFRLQAAGVLEISGGGFCTVGEQARFYSYRRDSKTGRMATLIWLADQGV